jgi:peptidoglycan/LPS O-acetylase OafA/YrhL
MFERVLLVFTGSSGARILYGTDTRADALLLGCAIAVAFSAGTLPVIENRLWHQRAPADPELPPVQTRRFAYLLASNLGVPLRFCVERILPRRFRDNRAHPDRGGKLTVLFPCVATASLAGLVFFSQFAEFSYDVDLCIAYALISLCAAGVFLYVIVFTSGIFHWMLSRNSLVYMGKISYGLYLWHYPIFGTVQIQHWPAATELAVEFGLTAIVVLASYYFLEKPLLAVKSRFARVD